MASHRASRARIETAPSRPACRRSTAVVVLAVGLYQFATLNLFITMPQAAWPRIVQLTGMTLLFSPINTTGFAALLLVALCIAGAIFVILEMYQPFSGLVQIDSDTLRNALPPLTS